VSGSEFMRLLYFMTSEQYEQARSVKKALGEVENELKAWKETETPRDLGHKQHWNNGHLVALPSKHSPAEAFVAYKSACVNALKVKKAELDEMFLAI